MELSAKRRSVAWQIPSLGFGLVTGPKSFSTGCLTNNAVNRTPEIK